MQHVQEQEAKAQAQVQTDWQERKDEESLNQSGVTSDELTKRSIRLSAVLPCPICRLEKQDRIYCLKYVVVVVYFLLFFVFNTIICVVCFVFFNCWKVFVVNVHNDECIIMSSM